MKDELLDEIENIIDKEENGKMVVLQAFFDLLFWKDYSTGYVEPELKWKIHDLLDTHFIKRAGDDEWTGYDDEMMFVLANDIRKKINLPILKKENGMILEVKK